MIFKLLKIWRHFGHVKQKFKLIEECNEFTSSPMDKSEIADVFIVAFQFFLSDKEIRSITRFKIKRTLKRIKEDYYK